MNVSSGFVHETESDKTDVRSILRIPPNERRLGQALLARSSLWAICSCGREAAIDPAAWLGQGLSRQPLEQLESRLRCHCGARHARLEIRGLSEAPAGPTGGIHVFR